MAEVFKAWGGTHPTVSGAEELARNAVIALMRRAGYVAADDQPTIIGHTLECVRYFHGEQVHHHKNQASIRGVRKG